MPQLHFEHFLQHLSWSAPKEDDACSPIRDWITEFNARRVAVLTPTDRITVDELMSANRTSRTRLFPLARHRRTQRRVSLRAGHQERLPAACERLV